MTLKSESLDFQRVFEYNERAMNQAAAPGPPYGGLGEESPGSAGHDAG